MHNPDCNRVDLDDEGDEEEFDFSEDTNTLKGMDDEDSCDE